MSENDPLKVFVDNQIKGNNDNARIMTEINNTASLPLTPLISGAELQTVNALIPTTVKLPGSVSLRRCTSAYIKMSEILAHIVGSRLVTNALHNVHHVPNKTLRAIAAYYEIPVDFLTRDGIANMLSKVLFTVNDTHELSEHSKIYASELAAKHEERYEIDENSREDMDYYDEDNASSLISDLVTNMSVYDKRYYRRPSSLPDIGTLKHDSTLSYDPRARAHQRFVHADDVKIQNSIHATLRWSKSLQTYAEDIMKGEAQNFFIAMLYLVPADDALLLSPISSNETVRKLNKLFKDCGANQKFSVKSLQQLHNKERRISVRSRNKNMMRSVLGLN